jgi:protein RecA
MERKPKPKRKSLSDQMKKRSNSKLPTSKGLDGNTDVMISTGSTLLDLAISGGRVRGGGIPGGILVEVFGPSGAGKTVLLCEIAGAVQRKGGEIMFQDPEARLNKQFARIFDVKIKDDDYSRPNTVPEVFEAVREWKPEKKKGTIHGSFADSLAALSTDMEMDKKEGDKMGMRRAKEFSEQLRKTCRELAEQNLLMVCSNQVRESGESYGPKWKSPGGVAIGFYSSLRLRFNSPVKIKDTIKVAGKEVTRVKGVTAEIEIFKSSIWKPFRTAPVTIIFDYGIDDIRQNLQFIKNYTKATTYSVGGEKLDIGMETAIKIVEEDDLVKELREEVIDLWEEIEEKFNKKGERKPKQR